MSDPTRQEILDFVHANFSRITCGETLAPSFEEEADGCGDWMDVETAIWHVAADCHSGQSSNLYSVLSMSDYQPSPVEREIEADENPTAHAVYTELVEWIEGGA